MSLIPGVGYESKGSIVYWVDPVGKFLGTSSFNLSAGDPFGRQLDISKFQSRYGMFTKSGRWELADGTICRFPVDAESIGTLMVAMELAAKSGKFSHEFSGTSATHTMVPTNLEAHDYAATHQDGGRGLMSAMGVGGGAGGSGSGAGGATGVLPGRPRIDGLSSSPGVLTIKWITSQATAFELNVETAADDGPGWTHTFPDPGPGNTRQLSFQVPNYIYGSCVVKLRAYRGATFGPWSMSKKVDIVKSDKPVEPTEEETNPIPLDIESRSAISTLAFKGYSKEQILNAYDRIKEWMKGYENGTKK